MTDHRRLTRTEIEILRRSVAASGQLPRDQVERLLDEVAILLQEREQVARLVANVAPPWRDVRGALNEIHRVMKLPDRASQPRDGASGFGPTDALRRVHR